jgi:transcriptional regulator with XRE-family HTH domain
MRSTSCRLARNFLDWTLPDLAGRSGVGATTIRDFEMGRHRLQKRNIDLIELAFRLSGIGFGQNGIERIPDHLTEAVSIPFTFPPISTTSLVLYWLWEEYPCRMLINGAHLSGGTAQMFTEKGFHDISVIDLIWKASVISEEEFADLVLYWQANKQRIHND